MCEAGEAPGVTTVTEVFAGVQVCEGVKAPGVTVECSPTGNELCAGVQL